MFTIGFPLFVASRGVGAAGLGALAAASVVTGAVFTYFFSRSTGAGSVRSFLSLSALLMLAVGGIYATAHSMDQIMLGALGGFIPPAAGLFAGAVEEGCLAQLSAAHRARGFAIYGMLGTLGGAVGTLAAGVPAAVGLTGDDAQRALFWAFAAMGLAVLVLVRRLPAAEMPGRRRVAPSAGEAPKRDPLLWRLGGLFVVDSMGSGMVASTLLVYWLHERFRLESPTLAALFCGIELLSAMSFPLAVQVGRRWGLLNTAVFTHIPSSLLLVAVPFAPDGLVAASLLLARAALVEMDVPTRQLWMSAVVLPEERARAAGFTSLGRQVGRALGPAIGGGLLQAAGAAAPFVLGGMVKIAYDLALWRSMRGVHPPDDDRHFAPRGKSADAAAGTGGTDA